MLEQNASTSSLTCSGVSEVIAARCGVVAVDDLCSWLVSAVCKRLASWTGRAKGLEKGLRCGLPRSAAGVEGMRLLWLPSIVAFLCS